MSKTRIVLRDEISGQTHEYSAAEAKRILAHPIWGKRNKEVRVNKPEVLKTSTRPSDPVKPSDVKKTAPDKKKDAN